MQSDPARPAPTTSPIHPDPRIQRALSRGHRMDITTIGRKTGRPRRIELVFHNIDGRVFISGSPGRRDWYANLLANPAFTFHLTGPVQADLPAVARPITEPVERRQVMERVAANWGVTDRLDIFLRRSPLVEVTFPAA
jgi:deazaflavin-dependent oxidoreductase (nitroreductase family)